MTDASESDDCSPTLLRIELPDSFERWEESLPPGAERPTDARDWAGALVLVESGMLEVCCVAGERCTFVEGDMLALGWLPLSSMRNPGHEPMRLVALRRRSDRPARAPLHAKPRTRLGSSL